MTAALDAIRADLAANAALRAAAQLVMDEHRKGYWSVAALNALEDALNGSAEHPFSAAHPGTPHEFRTMCQRCGENGYLHVALITDLEVVHIEPRAVLRGEP